MRCVFIDQQGGKGNCASAMDVCGTICSDSHGTPHAVAIIGGLMNVSESTRPADDADILGARCVPRCMREQRGRNGKGRSLATGAICFTAYGTRLGAEGLHICKTIAAIDHKFPPCVMQGV